MRTAFVLFLPMRPVTGEVGDGPRHNVRLIIRQMFDPGIAPNGTSGSLRRRKG